MNCNAYSTWKRSCRHGAGSSGRGALGLAGCGESNSVTALNALPGQGQGDLLPDGKPLARGESFSSATKSTITSHGEHRK